MRWCPILLKKTVSIIPLNCYFPQLLVDHDTQILWMHSLQLQFMHDLDVICTFVQFVAECSPHSGLRNTQFSTISWLMQRGCEWTHPVHFARYVEVQPVSLDVLHLQHCHGPNKLGPEIWFSLCATWFTGAIYGHKNVEHKHIQLPQRQKNQI